MSSNQKSSRLGPAASAGRRIQVAGVVIAALVIGVGYGYAKPAASSAASASKSAAQSTTTPISSATVVCPLVKDSSSTNISTFTPGTVSVSGSSGESVGQLQGSNSLLTAGKAGTLSTASGVSGGSEAAEDVNNPVIATATGADAAGFTVTETMPSGSNSNTRGLASQNCGSPDTDMWFVGLGTDSSAYAMLNMVNADNQSASVSITMYTAGGQLAQGEEATSLQGITISPKSQKSELVNTLDTQKQGAPYAIHVVASSGRIAASVLDWDGNGGGRDFVDSQKSATMLVFPGIPQSENNEKVQLTVLSPTAGAAVALRWVGHSTIQPAVGGSSFSGNLVQGKTATVDLSSVPQSGEFAALEVCGANSASNQCLPVAGGSGGAIPLVGEVKVSQSDNGGQDTAYISPVLPLSGDGIVADNTSNSVVTLTNNGSSAAQVKLTETGSGNNPASARATVSVPAGQTVNAPLAEPKGASGDFALMVTPLNGAQHVYAARIYATGSNLSIQTLTTAAETVTVPAVGQDSSGLVPQN
ncbi:DUF5719 family protein [Actinospica sp.]|uniref:DUF5719 family protein n=1 Tax=Actinospica sp. TaxID=1872142 RepID=UPI002BFBCE67|nr:DUF5719 family protein [Actinospica sp.]HWG28403.1 DUF5719 family protein [Actinospica sp.]